MRFTQTPSAFYITTLYAPNDTLVLDSPVPYLGGDRVTVVGGGMAGAVVPSERLANGSLRLNVSDEVRAADEYAWVFKISYDDDDGAVNGSDAGSGDGGASGPGGLPSGSAEPLHEGLAWSLAAAASALAFWVLI